LEAGNLAVSRAGLVACVAGGWVIWVP
jgi:hypothetical protein